MAVESIAYSLNLHMLQLIMTSKFVRDQLALHLGVWMSRACLVI